MKFFDPNRGRVRVGILRGGERDYQQSIRHGADIITFLIDRMSNKYRPIDILVDREGVWHVHGVPILPANLTHKVDVVWNTAGVNHSGTLAQVAIPYIGPSVFLSGILRNRSSLKEHMRSAGIKTVRHIVFPAFNQEFDGPKEEYARKKAREVFEKFSSPWVIRSLTSESSIPVRVANTFPELVRSIEDISSRGVSVLVEELIIGKEISAHALPHFREETNYHLPLIEKKGEIVFVPSHLSDNEKEEILETNKKVLENLGVKHYLKSHFILHPKRGVYLKEISFDPDFFKDKYFRKACESVGIIAEDTIDHILQKALKNL